MSIVTYNWNLKARKKTFWSYKLSAFNDVEIDKIHRLAKSNSLVGGILSDNTIDDRVRTSEMCFLPSSDSNCNWVFNKFTELVNEANTTLYNFDLSSIESLQYTVYNKGSFYTEHVDTLNHSFGGERKLSFVLMLSDEHEYEGGDLVLKLSDKPIVAPRRKGTVIFFPSYSLHEVQEVTKGVRKTLVGWVLGPEFR